MKNNCANCEKDVSLFYPTVKDSEGLLYCNLGCFDEAMYVRFEPNFMPQVDEIKFRFWRRKE
jgi:hypothetical protein